jgi:hypothetical protein
MGRGDAPRQAPRQLTSQNWRHVTLTPIPSIVVSACLLVASCSRQVTPPEERAPATAAISQASASPVASPAQVSTETAIQDIRTRYADVRRRLSSFREVERDVTGLSTEGGKLHAFFDGQALKLVRVTFYGETGRTDREFYYEDNGRPFFVLDVESRYDAPLGATAGKQEYRSYFSDGRLVRLLAGDRQVSADDPAYAAREKNTLELSRRLWDVARHP